MGKLIKTFLGAVVGLVVAGMVTAQGAVVSYNFSGALYNVGDAGNLLGGAFSVGDTFSGTLSYESNSPDGSPDPTYFTSPADVYITTNINAYAFTTTTSSVDLNSNANYIYFISGFASTPFINLGSNPGRLMTIKLSDTTKSVFNEDELPTELDFDALTDASFRIFGDTGPGGPTFSLNGNITSLTAIPLPAAAWLFLTGLGLVGAAAWRKQRAA